MGRGLLLAFDPSRKLADSVRLTALELDDHPIVNDPTIGNWVPTFVSSYLALVSSVLSSLLVKPD